MGLLKVMLVSADATVSQGAIVYFTVHDPETAQRVTTAAASLFAAGDVKYWDGDSWENPSNSVADVGSGLGVYSITLTAGELGNLISFLSIVDQTAAKVWMDEIIELIATEDGGNYGQLGDVWSTGGTDPVRANIIEVYGLDVGKSLLYILQQVLNYRVNADITITTTTFAADYLGGQATTQDDGYRDRQITWITGNLQGTSADIVAYTASTEVFVTTEMVAVPANADLFIIV